MLKIKYKAIYLFFLLYLHTIIKSIPYLLVFINLICNIDIEILIEHYNEDMLFMDDASSGSNPFKKPKLYTHETPGSGDSRTGEKRPMVLESDSDKPTYIRDNSSQISSRNPSDWGVDEKHEYSDYQKPKEITRFSEVMPNSRFAKYTEDCDKMANLLEFHAKVHGRKEVHTYLDDNPMMGEQASQFFEGFTESKNIKPKTGSDCIANTTALRNAFRKYH